MGVGILLRLIVGQVLGGLYVQILLDLRTHVIQGGGLGRGDAHQLGHRQAELALDRSRDLAGLQGEHRLGDALVADRGGGHVGIADRLDAIGAGDGAGVLALGEPRGDRRRLCRVLGRDLDEAAPFRNRQPRLLDIERLLHVRFTGMQADGDRLGADADQGDHARLGLAQPIGVQLDELVQLGVGGLGRRRLSFRVQQEVVGRAGLLVQRGEHHRIARRRLQSGRQGRGEVDHRELVAQVLLELQRRQVAVGQQLLVGLFVKGAGHRIEEGRDLAHLVQHQLIGGLDARTPDRLEHGFLVGHVLQRLLDHALLDRLVEGDGLAGLLLELLQLLGEALLEVGRIDHARAGLHHRVADAHVEDVSDPPDTEADDQ